MIMDKDIEIIVGSHSINHYRELGYLAVWNEKLVIKIEHLTKNSHVLVDVKCDICGNEKKLKYQKYIQNTKFLTESYCCSKQCSHDKKIKTCFKNNGCNYPQQNKEIHNKSRLTCFNNYGVENPNQSSLIRERTKQTNLIRFGVEYPSQNKEIFNKQQQSSCKIKNYKNTNLLYQGTYELFFLEQMEEKGLLNEISKGKTYDYILNGKKHVYHSDYWFNNSVIEIKSTWTYNKNGKDKELELENETKWQAVRYNGNNITILFSKNEIENYIKELIVEETI